VSCSDGEEMEEGDGCGAWMMGSSLSSFRTAVVVVVVVTVLAARKVQAAPCAASRRSTSSLRICMYNVSERAIKFWG
jgi:hypothetical protein